jgi:hypothetical protein
MTGDSTGMPRVSAVRHERYTAVVTDPDPDLSVRLVVRTGEQPSGSWARVFTDGRRVRLRRGGSLLRVSADYVQDPPHPPVAGRCCFLHAVTEALAVPEAASALPCGSPASDHRPEVAGTLVGPSAAVASWVTTLEEARRLVPPLQEPKSVRAPAAQETEPRPGVCRLQWTWTPGPGTALLFPLLLHYWLAESQLGSAVDALRHQRGLAYRPDSLLLPDGRSTRLQLHVVSAPEQCRRVQEVIAATLTAHPGPARWAKTAERCARALSAGLTGPAAEVATTVHRLRCLTADWSTPLSAVLAHAAEEIRRLSDLGPAVRAAFSGGAYALCHSPAAGCPHDPPDGIEAALPAGTTATNHQHPGEPRPLHGGAP